MKLESRRVNIYSSRSCMCLVVVFFFFLDGGGTCSRDLTREAC